MNFAICGKCGFLFEVIDHSPCPTCPLIDRIEDNDDADSI